VIAVAEPLAPRRELFADRAGVATEHRYASWPELMARAPELKLDAVVVALPDSDHSGPTIAAAQLGLAVLLEKPIATNEQDLRALADRLEGLNPRIAVAHVLRETPFWRSVHAVTSSGALGSLATIRLEENIGFWHFAHSYVRGNWRNTAESSPMVLAKNSHDLDLIQWIVGSSPERVSSVGSLLHFHGGNAPDGGPSHCVHGCAVSESCPFYAPRYYAEALKDVDGWPVALIGDDVSAEGRLRSLATSPYGRCVYRCDNDVVDHQQTIFEFPGGVTASLTTSAFTGANTRTFQVTGTRGELSGRMESGELRLELFAPGPHTFDEHGLSATHSLAGPLQHDVFEWRAVAGDADVADHRGHAGGDDALTAQFVDAVASDNFGAYVTTTFQVSYGSHIMAFSAERARLEKRVVEFNDSL